MVTRLRSPHGGRRRVTQLVLFGLPTLLVGFLGLSRFGSFLGPTTAHADLEIAFPPGRPPEWLIELPFHVLRPERSPIYTHTSKRKKADEDTTPGSTGVVKKEKAQPPSVEARAGAFNPLAAARVLTQDIVGHLPWTEFHREEKLPGVFDYPPQVRAELHWLVLAGILRLGMHPQRSSVPETFNYLVMIGSPARDVITTLPGEDDLKQALLEEITGTPGGPPDLAPLLKLGANAEEKMLIRWAARELVSDHYYAYNPVYGRRTLSLGAEAIPILAACSRSKHPILKQSATALLSAYSGYDLGVLERVRELAKGGDRVCAYRALAGLASGGDPVAEDILLKHLKSSDRYYRAFALHYLGAMHSTRARALVRRVLASAPRDHGQTWMAAVPALAKMGDPDEKTRDLFQRVIRVTRGLPSIMDGPPTRWGPDNPDRKGDRARLIAQAAQIGLAYLGDTRYDAYLLGLFDGEAPPGGVRRGRADPNPYPKIEGYNVIFALDALTRIGPKGATMLRTIIRTSGDTTIEAVALRRLADLAGSREFLVDTASSPNHSTSLRVQAMQYLAESDNTIADAIEAAEGLIDEYLSGDPKPDQRAQRYRRIPFYGCLAAVKLLGQRSPLPASRLVQIIERARALGHYERARMINRKPSNPRQGNQGKLLEYFPPLYEVAIVELGRVAYPNSVWVLQNLLANPQAPGRAEAALALGNIPTKGVCESLLVALRSKDAWVRYCAYRSLRRIAAGQADHTCNWLFGTVSELRIAHRAWQEWLDSDPPGLLE